MGHSSRITKRKSGFTLLEGLFSLFLISMVLTSLAATLKGALKVRQASAGSGVAGEVDHVVTLLRRDLASALETEFEEKQLSLKMVDPGLTYEQRRPGGPFAEGFMVKVRYIYRDGALYRHFIRQNDDEVDFLVQLQDFKLTGGGGLVRAQFVQKTQGALKRYNYSFRKSES
jgi:type II secretory pathway component PulJ